MLAQHRVGRDIPLVAEDHARSDGQVVGSVIPLLPLGRPDVLVGSEHGDGFDLQDLRKDIPQAVVPRDGEPTELRATHRSAIPVEYASFEFSRHHGAMADFSALKHFRRE